MAKFVVTSFDKLGDALLRASGVDPNYVRRLVLDLRVGEPGMLYVETFADSEVLDVELSEMGIVVSEAENGG